MSNKISMQSKNCRRELGKWETCYFRFPDKVLGEIWILRSWNKKLQCMKRLRELTMTGISPRDALLFREIAKCTKCEQWGGVGACHAMTCSSGVLSLYGRFKWRKHRFHGFKWTRTSSTLKPIYYPYRLLKGMYSGRVTAGSRKVCSVSRWLTELYRTWCSD
jgi:hypothetical protein